MKSRSIEYVQKIKEIASFRKVWQLLRQLSFGLLDYGLPAPDKDPTNITDLKTFRNRTIPQTRNYILM